MTLRNEIEVNLSWFANDKYTWSYENDGKLNFLCKFSKRFLLYISLFTVCCSRLMSVFFTCFLDRDLCRGGWRHNWSTPPPPFSNPSLSSPPRPYVFVAAHNSLFNTSDSYISEIRARLKVLSALFSSLILADIGDLEKGFPESTM